MRSLFEWEGLWYCEGVAGGWKRFVMVVLFSGDSTSPENVSLQTPANASDYPSLAPIRNKVWPDPQKITDCDKKVQKEAEPGISI